MAAPQASSRLEMMQARFQQKQLQEKEQKLLQLYDQQQQRAYQVVQRGSAGSTGSNHGSSVSQQTVTRTTTTTHSTSTSQGGKVRQMFDERRQTTVKGIDRSYPLEPLDSKPRKQPTSNGHVPSRTGNGTTNRQSVTVRRVARADVNSNVNGGKPVVSYHEEVTRESYGDDDDEYENENRNARYSNGNHRNANRNEVHIEEVIDDDAIEKNRMMAKIHLMEFDKTMKHRVNNDLDSEQFPEDPMLDVLDKMPKRTATRKPTQAEARLERFKNANARRNNAVKTASTTVTRKRSEPMFPAGTGSSREPVGRTRTGRAARSPEPVHNPGSKPARTERNVETSRSCVSRSAESRSESSAYRKIACDYRRAVETQETEEKSVGKTILTATTESGSKGNAPDGGTDGSGKRTHVKSPEPVREKSRNTVQRSRTIDADDSREETIRRAVRRSRNVETETTKDETKRVKHSDTFVATVEGRRSKSPEIRGKIAREIGSEKPTSAGARRVESQARERAARGGSAEKFVNTEKREVKSNVRSVERNVLDERNAEPSTRGISITRVEVNLGRRDSPESPRKVSSRTSKSSPERSPEPSARGASKSSAARVESNAERRRESRNISKRTESTRTGSSPGRVPGQSVHRAPKDSAVQSEAEIKNRGAPEKWKRGASSPGRSPEPSVTHRVSKDFATRTESGYVERRESVERSDRKQLNRISLRSSTEEAVSRRNPSRESEEGVPRTESPTRTERFHKCLKTERDSRGSSPEIIRRASEDKVVTTESFGVERRGSREISKHVESNKRTTSSPGRSPEPPARRTSKDGAESAGTNVRPRGSPEKSKHATSSPGRSPEPAMRKVSKKSVVEVEDHVERRRSSERSDRKRLNKITVRSNTKDEKGRSPSPENEENLPKTWRFHKCLKTENSDVQFRRSERDSRESSPEVARRTSKGKTTTLELSTGKRRSSLETSTRTKHSVIETTSGKAPKSSSTTRLEKTSETILRPTSPTKPERYHKCLKTDVDSRKTMVDKTERGSLRGSTPEIVRRTSGDRISRMDTFNVHRRDSLERSKIKKEFDNMELRSTELIRKITRHLSSEAEEITTARRPEATGYNRDSSRSPTPVLRHSSRSPTPISRDFSKSPTPNSRDSRKRVMSVLRDSEDSFIRRGSGTTFERSSTVSRETTRSPSPELRRTASPRSKVPNRSASKSPSPTRNPKVVSTVLHHQRTSAITKKDSKKMYPTYREKSQSPSPNLQRATSPTIKIFAKPVAKSPSPKRREKQLSTVTHSDKKFTLVEKGTREAQLAQRETSRSPSPRLSPVPRVSLRRPISKSPSPSRKNQWEVPTITRRKKISLQPRATTASTSKSPSPTRKDISITTSGKTESSTTERREASASRTSSYLATTESSSQKLLRKSSPQTRTSVRLASKSSGSREMLKAVQRKASSSATEEFSSDSRPSSPVRRLCRDLHRETPSPEPHLRRSLSPEFRYHEGKPSLGSNSARSSPDRASGSPDSTMRGGRGHSPLQGVKIDTTNDESLLGRRKVSEVSAKSHRRGDQPRAGLRQTLDTARSTVSQRVGSEKALRSTELVRKATSSKNRSSEPSHLRDSDSDDSSLECSVVDVRSGFDESSSLRVTEVEEVVDAPLASGRRDVVSPGSSPKSSVSAEIDTDRHEIIIADQSVKKTRDSSRRSSPEPSSTISKGTAWVYTKSSSANTEKKPQDRSTFSIRKPTKKRTPLLEINVYERKDKYNVGKGRSEITIGMKRSEKGAELPGKTKTSPPRKSSEKKPISDGSRKSPARSPDASGSPCQHPAFTSRAEAQNASQKKLTEKTLKSAELIRRAMRTQSPRRGPKNEIASGQLDSTETDSGYQEIAIADHTVRSEIGQRRTSSPDSRTSIETTSEVRRGVVSKPRKLVVPMRRVCSKLTKQMELQNSLASKESVRTRPIIKKISGAKDSIEIDKQRQKSPAISTRAKVSIKQTVNTKKDVKNVIGRRSKRIEEAADRTREKKQSLGSSERKVDRVKLKDVERGLKKARVDSPSLSRMDSREPGESRRCADVEEEALRSVELVKRTVQEPEAEKRRVTLLNVESLEPGVSSESSDDKPDYVEPEIEKPEEKNTHRIVKKQEAIYDATFDDEETTEAKVSRKIESSDKLGGTITMRSRKVEKKPAHGIFKKQNREEIEAKPLRSVKSFVKTGTITIRKKAKEAPRGQRLEFDTRLCKKLTNKSEEKTRVSKSTYPRRSLIERQNESSRKVKVDRSDDNKKSECDKKKQPSPRESKKVQGVKPLHSTAVIKSALRGESPELEEIVSRDDKSIDEKEEEKISLARITKVDKEAPKSSTTPLYSSQKTLTQSEKPVSTALPSVTNFKINKKMSNLERDSTRKLKDFKTFEESDDQCPVSLTIIKIRRAKGDDTVDDADKKSLKLTLPSTRVKSTDFVNSRKSTKETESLSQTERSTPRTLRTLSSDSVESALRRFDSIGMDTDTTRTGEVSPKIEETSPKKLTSLADLTSCGGTTGGISLSKNLLKPETGKSTESVSLSDVLFKSEADCSSIKPVALSRDLFESIPAAKDSVAASPRKTVVEKEKPKAVVRPTSKLNEARKIGASKILRPVQRDAKKPARTESGGKQDTAKWSSTFNKTHRWVTPKRPSEKKKGPLVTPRLSAKSKVHERDAGKSRSSASSIVEERLKPRRITRARDSIELARTSVVKLAKPSVRRKLFECWEESSDEVNSFSRPRSVEFAHEVRKVEATVFPEESKGVSDAKSSLKPLSKSSKIPVSRATSPQSVRTLSTIEVIRESMRRKSKPRATVGIDPAISGKERKPIKTADTATKSTKTTRTAKRLSDDKLESKKSTESSTRRASDGTRRTLVDRYVDTSVSRDPSRKGEKKTLKISTARRSTVPVFPWKSESRDNAKDSTAKSHEETRQRSEESNSNCSTRVTKFVECETFLEDEIESRESSRKFHSRSEFYSDEEVVVERESEIQDRERLLSGTPDSLEADSRREKHSDRAYSTTYASQTRASDRYQSSANACRLSARTEAGFSAESRSDSPDSLDEGQGHVRRKIENFERCFRRGDPSPARSKTPDSLDESDARRDPRQYSRGISKSTDASGSQDSLEVGPKCAKAPAARRAEVTTPRDAFRSTVERLELEFQAKPNRTPVKSPAPTSRVPAKSPSPDSAARKPSENVGTRTPAPSVRRSVPPSKSQEVVAARNHSTPGGASATSMREKDEDSGNPRGSAGTKSPEPKSTTIRKSPVTSTPKSHETLTSSRRSTTHATSTEVPKTRDVVDGSNLENDCQLQNSSRVPAVVLRAETPTSPKKAEAFVLDFGSPNGEANGMMTPVNMPSKRSPVRSVASSNKQRSPTTTPRPHSSLSTASNVSSTRGPAAGANKAKMTTKSPKTPTSNVRGPPSTRTNASSTSNDGLAPCKICGRRFAQERITLHEQICAKTAQKKRKQFDAMAFRVKGTDLEPFAKKGIGKKGAESKQKKPELKSNWRRKHEDFINAIRSAKQVQAHLAAGGKLSDLPPPPASDTSDYIQCPHCGRKFNQGAADRHIPKCQTMMHNKPNPRAPPKPKR